MGFAEYQGMSEREILIDMAGRLEVIEAELACRKASRRSGIDYIVNIGASIVAVIVAYLLGKAS